MVSADAATAIPWPQALYSESVTNVYFELTREFNRPGPVAVLASGQAVVYYRLAIMSKDGDRILELATSAGSASSRPSVRAALNGEGRSAVVAALAQEIDEMQRADRKRLAVYERAAEPYLAEFQRLDLSRLPLARAHDEACRLAETLLPERPTEE
jgi:hypothetical protein